MSDGNSELPTAFKDCLKGISSTFDEIAKEFLYGHFPALNEKEYVLCQVLASAYHDTDWGNYNYVIDVTTHYYREIFSGQKEVESTNQDLIEKGIIQSTLMEEERELRLKDNVQDELVGSWRIEFASAVMAGIASTDAIF